MAATAVVRGYTMGDGAPWIVDDITGIFDIAVKSADTDLHFDDGVKASRDYRAPSPIVVSMHCLHSFSAAIAGLQAAWAPSHTDIAFTFDQGLVSGVVAGRPRGLAVRTGQLKFGLVRAQATFLANP